MSRQKGWSNSGKKKALDELKIEAREIAENLRNTEDDKDTPHHELAVYIYDEALKAKYKDLRDFYIGDYFAKDTDEKNQSIRREKAEKRADKHLKEVIRSAIITPEAKERGLVRGTKEYKEK